MARRRAQLPAQSATQDGCRFAKESDSDDGAAKTKSRQDFDLSHVLKKSKSDDKDVQQFRAKVAADQKKLKAVLEQRVRQAEKEAMRRRSVLASKIFEALQTRDGPTQGETPNFPGTKIAGNAVYTSLADVLTASEGLINEYQGLDGIIMGLQNERAETIADIWKQNIDETERQLRMGARVALRNAKKVLGADVESEGLGVTDEGGDMDMERGEGVEKMELNYELQKSLRYAERGFKRMVKGLPDDEGH